MSVILGIDIGGSTTKIVGIRDGYGHDRCNEKIIGKLQVRANDQVTSMYGAIGNFLRCQKLNLTDVSAIYLTGVGASFIDDRIYEIETHKVSEFKAVGIGALRLSNFKEALVVSMGTGTAFVKATIGECVHIGGTGIGGGAIIGLASQMLYGGCKNDIDAVLVLAEKGDLNNVDLFVKDIVSEQAQTLPLHLTAANFGKLKSTATDSDIALGIINMVFETVGMMAVLAIKSNSQNELKGNTLRDVILTGTLATFPQAKPIYAKFTEFTGINFVIPEDAVFATAIGALPAR